MNAIFAQAIRTPWNEMNKTLSSALSESLHTALIPILEEQAHAFAAFYEQFAKPNISQALRETLTPFIQEFSDKSESLLSACSDTGDSSVDESVCEIPDSLSDTIKPVLEFITEQQVVPENLSPDHVDAVRNFKAETQRTKKLSQNAIQCLISALLTIGLFVLGQILTSQDSAHTSQQLDRQIAISEEQLEQSKLTNELLEEHIRLLQSIDDSIDQLMEARDIPVQDVHPSNETQDHPTE